MYECLTECMNVHLMCTWCPVSPEDNARSGTGLTVVRVHVGAEKGPQVRFKSNQ